MRKFNPWNFNQGQYFWKCCIWIRKQQLRLRKPTSYISASIPLKGFAEKIVSNIKVKILQHTIHVPYRSKVRNIWTMDQNPDTTVHLAGTVTQKKTCNEPTACVTPSPASNTTPVVRPVAYKLSTACSDTKSAGTLKVSKNISAAFSRFRRGFSGASVSNTGCSSENVCSWSLLQIERKNFC